MSKTPKRPKGRKTPQQRRRQGRIITVIIGVLAILSTIALLMLPKMTQTDATPMVATQAVQKGDVDAYLEVSGTVKSLRTKTYYSPVNATVKDYAAKTGQMVTVGTTLVSFETGSLERDNQKGSLNRSVMVNTNQDTMDKAYQTWAEAETARGNAAILKGDIKRYKEFINNLKQDISNRTIELAQQEPDIEEDDPEESADLSREFAALSCALELAKQKESLVSQNRSFQAEVDGLAIIQSRSEFDGDTNTAETIASQIEKKTETMETNRILISQLENQLGDYADASSADIQEMLDGISAATEAGSISLENINTAGAAADAQLAQWQLDLENAQTTLAELQSDLATEEAKVDAADAAEISQAGRKVMEDNNNLADLESASLEELLEKGRRGIKAEFNGIVTKAELFPGAEAVQGMELVSIASSDDVAVEVTVSKYDYNKLKEGQKAQITIANKTYQGTVGDISRVAKQNEKGAPIITCEVNIDNPDDSIFLGVEAKASILTGSEKNVLTVPVEAVNTGKDSTFCYVLEDGVIARRDVTAGISSDTETEIQQGLREGDLVIPQLPEGLTEGSPAKSIPAEDGQEGLDGSNT